MKSLWHEYVHFLERILTALGDSVHSGAIAIIIFTIIVKTLILPLTIKSIRSSKAMQELQPKLKEIQKKHGDDRQAASQAQMQLYQAYGVNPMAGCLPMVVQMPIFFGVYQAIRHMSLGDTVFSNGFLWIPSLAKADPYHILPILAGIFQWVQSRMMRPAHQEVTDSQQKMMNQMMNFMPLSVVLFGWQFAAGPVLYWVAQAIYSVVQQWLIGGWGALLEWFPWLPELPEHRRLGYHPPRNLDDVTIVSGQNAKPQGRFQQWMQGQMEKAEQQRKAQQEQREQTVRELTAKKPTAKSGSPGAPAPQRSDYQSRVNAASRYSDAPASDDTQSSTSSTTTVRPRRTQSPRRRR